MSLIRPKKIYTYTFLNKYKSMIIKKKVKSQFIWMLFLISILTDAALTDKTSGGKESFVVG